MLSKYERNEIFELIQQSVLDMADFDPPHEDDQGFTTIRHLPTGGTLSISDDDGVFGRLLLINGSPVVHTDGSTELVPVVRTWLSNLAVALAALEQDRRTPDLWAEFAREREALNGSVPLPADNTPFTDTERNEIETRLGEVVRYAAESGKFDADELQVLSAKMDYLIESSKHSRRFDWREQMVGAFLGAVAGNVLPQGATMDVLNMMVGTVGHLIGHPVLGLPR